MKADEIEKTMQLINEKIRKKCDQNGDSAKEIYLLSLALKEMNQLEPINQQYYSLLSVTNSS